MLIDQTIVNYCQELDSALPAPGGGSVAALVGTLGVCLVRMCMHLSFSKKKYREADEIQQQKFIDRFERLLQQKNEIMKIIDEDATSYDAVIAAMQLPQTNATEIQIREQAIQSSLIQATQVPLSVMKLAVDAMEIASECVDLASPSAISDLLYGICCCESAVIGSSMNVKLNMKRMSEKNRQNYEKLCDTYLEKANQIKTHVLSEVNL